MKDFGGCKTFALHPPVTRTCKPGSVLTAIYLVPQSLTGSSRLLEAVGQTLCFSTALLRIEFTALQCSHGAGGLLHRLFTLTSSVLAYNRSLCRKRQRSPYMRNLLFLSNPLTLGFDRSPIARRYFSVALVLRSPSAGITCYPCPVEPGLSSHPAFRHGRAAVRPGR